MAHEVENMFSVNATPWHGLGTVLDAPPTVGEAIRLAGLDWGVTLEPLATPAGVIVDHRAVTRSSDGTVLGVVGSRYEPLQNAQAFDWFQPLVDSGDVTLETAGSLRSGARVWVMGRVQTVNPVEIVKGDPVCAYVLLSNSHDGTMSVRVGFTPIRVVCANTLGYAHADSKSQLIRLRHSKDVVTNLDALRSSMRMATLGFQASTELYKRLANTNINQADVEAYVKQVFEIKDDSRKVLDKILALYESGEGAELARGTLWGAYNAATEYVDHSRGADAAKRLDSAWFGSGAALSARALMVAETLVGA